jgi:hypothetical protein
VFRGQSSGCEGVVLSFGVHGAQCEAFTMRDAGCNGAKVQRCKGARVQGCKGARVQGCKGERVLGSRFSGSGVKVWVVRFRIRGRLGIWVSFRVNGLRYKWCGLELGVGWV